MKTFTVNYEIRDTKSGKLLSNPRPLKRVRSVAAAQAEIRDMIKRDRALYADKLDHIFRNFDEGEAGYVFKQGFTQRYYISQEGA